MASKNLSEILFRKSLITEHQFGEIENHRQQDLFSLRVEILFLILVSVLLFCTGAGIIIYNNIDSIGHIIILVLLFAVTTVAYAYNIRNMPGFSREKVVDGKPL